VNNEPTGSLWHNKDAHYNPVRNLPTHIFLSIHLYKYTSTDVITTVDVLREIQHVHYGQIELGLGHGSTRTVDRFVGLRRRSNLVVLFPEPPHIAWISTIPLMPTIYKHKYNIYDIEFNEQRFDENINVNKIYHLLRYFDIAYKVRPYLAHWLWKTADKIRIHDHGTGLTACVTDRQGMLTPPRHLIPPPAGPWVRVSHLFVWLVTPACVSRLIILWYLSHFFNKKIWSHCLESGSVAGSASIFWCGL
jgi:hypothetical protein